MFRHIIAVLRHIIAQVVGGGGLVVGWLLIRPSTQSLSTNII